MWLFGFVKQENGNSTVSYPQSSISYRQKYK